MWPLLFFLAEDILSRLLDKVVLNGKLKLIHGLRKYQCSSHLLYAEDIFDFLSLSKANIRLLSRIFDFYGGVSCQMVSWPKSSIYFGDRVSTPRVTSICSEVGRGKQGGS